MCHKAKDNQSISIVHTPAEAQHLHSPVLLMKAMKKIILQKFLDPGSDQDQYQSLIICPFAIVDIS